MTMLIPTLLLSFLCLSLSSPGVPWTEEESLIVKAKIYAIMGSGEKAEDYLKIHKEREAELHEYVTMQRPLTKNPKNWTFPEWPEPASVPNAPKFIRLGFHQCLKNSDGTGGCNGCLNNHGMGLHNRHNCSKPTDIDASEHRRDLPNAVKTNNAGLEMTADMLHEIFTNKDFPKNAPVLKVSLAESGKSRADLWSFAAAVGVEWGIEQNNLACDGKAPADSRRGNIKGEKPRNCPHYKEGEPDCRVEWPQPLKFYTGRSDCDNQGGWETTREESHPNPVGTGQNTVDFFKKDFGLTARESAALLLGAHSIGEFNFMISQFRYDWTKHQKRIMNNQLFRNIAMKPMYYTECRENNPYVGDYLGQPAATRWRVVGFECQEGGGPYHWFHQYYRVPASNTCTGVSAAEKQTTRTPALDFPEGDLPLKYCDKCKPGEDEDEDDMRMLSLKRSDDRKTLLSLMRAEPDTPDVCCENVPAGQKANKDGCQELIKNGETALGADMGFYFNFTVDPKTGKPGGCEGLTFNNRNKSPTVKCGMNHYAPEGEPLYQIVEDFADHQDNWIRDFMVAFDKMSQNGNTDLMNGPTSWFGATCNRLGKKSDWKWSCRTSWEGCTSKTMEVKNNPTTFWRCKK